MVKFYRCNHCGNIVMMVHDSKVPMMCCGEKMTELVAGSIDAAVEKHLPVVTQEGNKITVAVSSVEHPMLPEHYIMGVYIETKNGGQLHKFAPGDKPEAVFMLADGDEFIAAYEYCNLHGLWKSEV